ncbi:ABC transporter ATP-binding protein [Promicromonospora sp. NPDC057488]|uniref:ABC transporter ATP-binding protein n=1 Tax=Promicromonospora sp. NPDC057488 TaxID=3346147 RepID=UPI00366F8D9C
MTIESGAMSGQAGRGDGLEARSLFKSYGSRRVVEDVDLLARSGEITGFLGPNGAGKSTTMRMLAGLSRPDAGDVLVDGAPVRSVPNFGRTVGLLLDASAVHSGRSVRESMRIVTQTMGVPAARGDDLLDAVGLGSVLGRRMGGLSLGMRQRFGLAVALSGSPRYLILDEPMNGLDTEGIGWIKALLREFRDAGGGVLLSTHLIGEIQGVADRVVVINRGRIVAQGRPDEMGSQRTLVRSVDDDALVAALRVAGHDVRADESGLVLDIDPEAVGRTALDAGIVLIELRRVGEDLASYVLDHTDGEFAAATPRNTPLIGATR